MHLDSSCRNVVGAGVAKLGAGILRTPLFFCYLRGYFEVIRQENSSLGGATITKQSGLNGL